MKIGILKADSVLEQFQPDHGDYPAMFMKRLGENSPVDVEFETYDAEHGVYPEHIDKCDGYLITGSKRSVYEDEPWIQKLEAYVVELNEKQKPLVGICFGHQMVAQALGGKTEKAPAGWGVGVHTSQVVATKPFLEPALEAASMLVSHQDQVTELPEGAELIAASDFCPFSMYQVGDHIFCMQGHPEFRHEYSRDLINMRRELIGETTFDSGIASLEQTLDSDTVALWIIQFFEQASARYAAAA